MRVVFVNRFYWPAEPATAQLLTDLAEALAAGGAQVSVITGHSSPGLAAHETHHGVEIHRVGPAMSSGRALAGKAADFVRFHLAASRQLGRTLRPGDVVVALTDPPLIGVTASRAAFAAGARTVHWIHDIYPEVVQAVADHPTSRLAVRLLRPLRDRAWRRAAACVTLGEQMAAVVRAAGVRSEAVQIVPNWAPKGVLPADPAHVARQRALWELGDRMTIVYSGNLGRVHDLSGVLDVARELQSDPRFVLLFIGGGPALASLRTAAEQAGLANVRFLPPQPRERLSTVLAVADLHLVSLREGCEPYVFPSKLYGIAAAGRPVVALGPPDAEISQLVNARRMGAAFRPHDTAGIAQFLRELADHPARLHALREASARFHEDSGGWSAGCSAWQRLLAAVASQPPAAK